MRRLSRYVIEQVLIQFSITGLAISVLLLLVGVAKEALNEGLAIGQVVRLVPYLLPNAFLFAVPGAILFAVCQVYGRMSSDNEIVAVKSLGIHPMVMVWPALILATLLSLATVWLNDLAVSWGYRGAQRLVLEAVEDIAYRTLAVRHSFSTRSFSMYVSRLEQKKLIDATFSFLPTGDSPGGTVTAREATLQMNSEQGVLEIVFSDGHIDVGDTHVRFPGNLEYQLSLDRVSRKDISLESPAHLALAEIPIRLAGQYRRIERVEDEISSSLANSLLSGDFNALSDLVWVARRQQLAAEQLQVVRLRLESPRRWANGFSCLGFAAVGIPIAIRLKNREFLTSVFLCAMPLLCVYYPLMMVAIDRAKSGSMPVTVIWLPNCILAAWSYGLFRRVLRN